MRISQAGILFLAAALLLSTTGCGRVMARKDIVDGAQAYKDRKFPEAEAFFRNALKWDPSQKIAKLFLARTLHSEFGADRDNLAKAEEAIKVYQEVVAETPADNTSFQAVANLLETLKRDAELQKWLEDRAAGEAVPKHYRAEAYTTLAAKQYACANDISDIEPVKKTVEKNGKAEFVFSKPANPEDFEKLKGCIAKGNELIEKALGLQEDTTKTASLAAIDATKLSYKEMKDKVDLIKPFESAWSYETSLLVQSARLAEMEGNAAEKDRFKKEADEAKAKFIELADARKKIEDEESARRKAEEEEKK